MKARSPSALERLIYWRLAWRPSIVMLNEVSSQGHSGGGPGFHVLWAWTYSLIIHTQYEANMEPIRQVPLLAPNFNNMVCHLVWDDHGAAISVLVWNRYPGILSTITSSSISSSYILLVMKIKLLILICWLIWVAFPMNKSFEFSESFNVACPKAFPQYSHTALTSALHSINQ